MKRLAGLQLPDAVIVCILEHVPFQKRLQLALVARAWAAAAALATSSVDFATTSPSSTQQIQHRIKSCAGHLQGLSVKAPPESVREGQARHVLHLPCSKFTQLVTLKLKCLQVVVPSTGNMPTQNSAGDATASMDSNSSRALVPPDPAAAGFLPALQHLELTDCELSIDGLQQLAQLTGLTTLNLKWRALYLDNSFTQALRYKDPRRAEALAALLADLPNLADLSVDTSDDACSDKGLGAISSMQHLQRLRLHSCLRAPAVLQLMLSSLTAVRFEGCGNGTTLTASHLTNLVQLELVSLFAVDPRMLYSCPKLQQLVLHEVKLQPAGMGKQSLRQHATDRAKQQHAESMRHLFAALEGMTSLQHLSFSYNTPLSCSATAAAARMDGEDIGRRIAGCCPALQRLKLCNILRDAAAASSLQQLSRLTALTQLDILGWGCHDTAAAAVAHLTGLCDLRLLCSSSRGTNGQVTVSGLQQLTALRSLTQLRVHGWREHSGKVIGALGDPDGRKRVNGKLALTQSSKRKEAVWQQLERLCQAAVNPRAARLAARS